MNSKLFSPSLVLNFILFIAFSISVNTFVSIQNINILFYIFFHLTFIYLLFYHYHYSIFFISFIYGILLDVLLLNVIGSHLVIYFILIFAFNLFKKYLFLLSPNQISITIFFILIITISSILFFAYLINNIYFTHTYLIKILIILMIIYIPSIFILNKLDR